MSSQKQYLGDGVYVDVEHDRLKLTTENGVATTNTIYLEDEVIAHLMLYIARAQKVDEVEELLDPPPPDSTSRN